MDGEKRRDADRRLRQAVRFARILKLLELLQGRDRHDTVSLGTALEVSRRTVLRDIDVLRLAGVGLDYNPSNKGYALHGDYRFAVTGLSDAHHTPVGLRLPDQRDPEVPFLSQHQQQLRRVGGPGGQGSRLS